VPVADPAQSPEAHENIGEATYRAVNELTSRKVDPLTRAQAFAALAEEQGRQEGTVSANYYRVARKRGEGRSQRKKAPARTPRAARPPQGNALLEAIARAQEALKEVEAAARDDLKVRQQLKSLL
jgi:sirohydrochlorin ferrochelatase